MAFLCIMKPLSDCGPLANIRDFAGFAGPRAELFCDERMTTFSAIQQKEKIGASALKCSVVKRFATALRNGSANSSGGEGMLPGGGLILDRSGRCIFCWREDELGSRPEDEEIEERLLAAVAAA